MENKYFKISSIIIILIIILGGGFYFYNSQQSIKNLGFKPLFIGKNTIDVEIMKTQEERARGLSNRESLGENNGMLFVFDRPDIYGFWMKDTNFPLDFIWINENKVIIDITQNVLPSSYPQAFYPSTPALYVLEVNAGYALKHQIKIGDVASF